MDDINDRAITARLSAFCYEASKLGEFSGALQNPAEAKKLAEKINKLKDEALELKLLLRPEQAVQ
jgi:hypothetical protein